MRLVVILSLFVLFVYSLVYPINLAKKLYKEEGQTAYPAYWFNQTLDHFNPQDLRTFAQRYYANNDNFQPERKVGILYINGEGPVYGPPYDPSDFTVILAKAFGAVIVTLEHRYYGLSQPFDNISTESLQYLSSRQALDDLATFLVWYQNNVLNAPEFYWITIGGSYSGALAAWFRLKYPHLTVGALASSGVVNAILDFTAFDEQVAISVGPECANLLRQITAQIENYVWTNESSKGYIKSLFQAEVLVEDGDFFYYVADKMAESVQYGFQNELCYPLLNAAANNQSILQVFANYTVNFAAPILGGPLGYSCVCLIPCQYCCVPEHQHFRRRELAPVVVPNVRGVRYTSAYFQCAPAEGSIRSSWVNMTYHRNMCSTLFGPTQNVWPNTLATNTYYGANHTAGTNIWFSNGSQDPWKRASVLYPLSLSEPALVIECETCGHCVDLRGCPYGCPEPNNLWRAREDIAAAIRLWLDLAQAHKRA